MASNAIVHLAMVLHIHFLGGTTSSRSADELQKEEDERAAQAAQASAEQIAETCRREGAWGFGPSQRYA